MKETILRFFKDEDGHIAVIQFPNIPLSVWIVTTAAGMVLSKGPAHASLQMVGTAFLVTWAYLEISSGLSPFRRVFGSLVMGTILVMQLINSPQ